jgi:hypothetical protein
MGNNRVVAGAKAMQDPVVAAHAQISKDQHILDNLLAQQAILVSKELDLTAEKRLLGYASFARQEAKSRERLTQVTQEHFTLESELSSLEGAVEEAQKRLAVSRENERLELQKAKARQILERLDDLSNAAISCDLALKQFVKSFVEMERTAATICATTNHPQREILRTLARRAVQTALLSQVRVFDFGFLAPGERLTFSDMAADWGRAASSWCAQRLGSPQLDVLPDLDAAE